MSISYCKHNVASPVFTIALFYRPPNAGHAPLDSLFSTFCNLFTLCLSNLYLVGDFNIDFLSKLSISIVYITDFYLLFPSFTFKQIVTEHTRVTSSTIIY